jgi:hypothetical protein
VCEKEEEKKNTQNTSLLPKKKLDQRNLQPPTSKPAESTGMQKESEVSSSIVLHARASKKFR